MTKLEQVARAIEGEVDKLADVRNIGGFYEQIAHAAVEADDGGALAKRAIDQLIELQSLDDPKGAHATNIQRSYAHGRADEIICRLLSDLGYGDVVREFEKIDRWYA